MLVRQSLLAPFLPSLGVFWIVPGNSIQQGQEVAPLSYTAGTGTALVGPPTSSIPGQGNVPPVPTTAGLGTRTLAPVRAILVSPVLTPGAAPGKGSSAGPQGRQARPRPSPLWGGGSSAARRRVGQQGACGGALDGAGEGTSKHSGSLAHVGWWRLRQTAGWRGPRGFRGRKGSVQHIQLHPRHRREGKEPAPPAVQQADGGNPS